MAASTSTSARDIEIARAYSSAWIGSPQSLPISFTYGGKPYHGLPAEWNAQLDRAETESIRSFTFTATEPRSRLTVTAECLEYKDFGAVEITVYFRNNGDSDTSILENVLGFDGSFNMDGGATLVTCNGDYYSVDGYEPTERILDDGDVFTQSPTGGRACNEAFPYQRLLFGDAGVNIAIGWPGEWQSRYENSRGVISAKLGQKVTHTVLRPGEALRSPRIALVFFDGGQERGINVWRRWYLAYVMPKRYGQRLKPFAITTCANVKSPDDNEFTNADEPSQLQHLDLIRREGVKCDALWIDAGWYPCAYNGGHKLWWQVGDWRPDPDKWPNGLTPIGKRCRELGMDLLVWFEPERVWKGSAWAKLYPQYMLDDGGSDNYLLNLADPECLDFLCRTIDGLIKESGITVYRQDFNFEPLAYWRKAETPDRAGMIENLYIQGYLAYWDYLLEHNPNLLIDSCSSGGRRNDYETMRRAVPLHQTDFGYGNHPVKQAFYQTLFGWIPFFRGYPLSEDGEDGEYNRPVRRELTRYSIINAFAPCTSFYGFEDWDGSIRRLADIWRESAEIMLSGDYYALTPFHKSAERWSVRQFDLPEAERGVIIALRHNRCEDEYISLSPCALDGDFRFYNAETGEEAEYADGRLKLRLDKRDGGVWFYERK